MSHLDNAKVALERRVRSGGHAGNTGPTQEDMLKAIKELIAHLEELEKRDILTVNKPSS